MRTHRPRRLALATAAVLIGAPVLWGSVAHAQSTDRVDFTGSCDDTASAATAPEHAYVPAGGTVELVNSLGERAVLSLDGEPAVELPPGGATGVVLYHGTVTATMRVACAAGDLTASVTIEVTDTAGQPGTRPRVGDPDVAPGGQAVPSPDRSEEADDGEASPSPSPDAEPDPVEGDDATSAQAPSTSGMGFGSGPEGVLAVLAALSVVAVSVAAFWVIAVRRTARTY
jgi:hypothetical protein